MTDDTVSGIKEDRASEGRERGTKQIERAWCLVGSARIQTFLSWLSVLVTRAPVTGIMHIIDVTLAKQKPFS